MMELDGAASRRVTALYQFGFHIWSVLYSTVYKYSLGAL